MTDSSDVAASETESGLAAIEPAAASDPEWRSEQVRKGDSLSAIFARLNLSPAVLHDVMQTGENAKLLKLIKPGQTIRFGFNPDGELAELVYEQDALQTVAFQRQTEGWSSSRTTQQYDRRHATATGVIQNSLFVDAQAAGLSERVIMALAGIFGWDIDFVLDIRTGDRFSVVYEELFLGADKVRDGEIVAAEFVNRGQVYRAVRYTDASGRTDYFSPDGKSMRKAFLRSPVDFARVSSRFGVRHHPVLKTTRNHNGVDYAAATGTPIRASGDGKIVHLGRKGGYGKTVVIQHGSEYSTLYAHMSRFNPALKLGTRVRQGQTIGYVGQTGLATGPHLHYEFQVNGVHRNPLTVKLPDAAPIERQHFADFTDNTRNLLAALDALSRTDIALTAQ